jgi:hypothetical protein
MLDFRRLRGSGKKAFSNLPKFEAKKYLLFGRLITSITLDGNPLKGPLWRRHRRRRRATATRKRLLNAKNG